MQFTILFISKYNNNIYCDWSLTLTAMEKASQICIMIYLVEDIKVLNEHSLRIY